MCGIAGCYQQADGQKLVDIMTDRIAHRGPDAAGTWSHQDEPGGHAPRHRRLSIIDLSAAANQPMSKDGLTLVYNGELYNYRELRADLKARGVRFATESDTEVVLEAWRRMGAGASAPVPRHVRVRPGRRDDRRSRPGPRPARHQAALLPPAGRAALVFASELKALMAAVGSELRIEPGAMVASMLYYWVPDQQCAIDGVRKLPPGSWARIRPDGALLGAAVLAHRGRGG